MECPSSTQVFRTVGVLISHISLSFYLSLVSASSSSPQATSQVLDISSHPENSSTTQLSASKQALSTSTLEEEQHPISKSPCHPAHPNTETALSLFKTAAAALTDHLLAIHLPHPPAALRLATRAPRRTTPPRHLQWILPATRLPAPTAATATPTGPALRVSIPPFPPAP